MPNEPGQSVVTPPTEVTPIDPDQAETVTDDPSQLKSLEDKLTYTLGTKTAIKNAIEAKGVTVPEGTVFRDYADKIGEIETGSSVQLVSGTVTTGRGTVFVYYTDGGGTFKRQVIDGTINVEINTFISVVSDLGHTVGGNASVVGNAYFVTGDFTVVGK